MKLLYNLLEETNYENLKKKINETIPSILLSDTRKIELIDNVILKNNVNTDTFMVTNKLIDKNILFITDNFYDKIDAKFEDLINVLLDLYTPEAFIKNENRKMLSKRKTSVLVFPILKIYDYILNSSICKKYKEILLNEYFFKTIVWNTIDVKQYIPIQIALKERLIDKISIRDLRVEIVSKEHFIEEYWKDEINFHKIISMVSLYEIPDLITFNFKKVLLVYNRKNNNIISYVLLGNPSINNQIVKKTNNFILNKKHCYQINSIIKSNKILIYGFIDFLKRFINKNLVKLSNINYNRNMFIFSKYEIGKHGGILFPKQNDNFKIVENNLFEKYNFNDNFINLLDNKQKPNSNYFYYFGNQIIQYS